MPDRCRPRKLSISRLKPRPSKPRAVVFDPATNSVTIELNENIDPAKAYWSFDIGKRPKKSRTSDHWDIVLDPYQDIVKAVHAGEGKSWHEIIITELRLDELSPWGKYLRSTGTLNRGYVRKTIEENTDGCVRGAVG